MKIRATINSLFEEQVQSSPRRLAARFGKERFTYAQLNKKANQIAHYLLAHGIQRDTPVAICVERSFDFLIAIMGIIKAGGAYLPIDSSHPKERLLFILTDSKAPLLITKSSFKEKFIDFTGQTLFMDSNSKEISKLPELNPEVEIVPEQLAYIIYTSGSTGTPKGVLIEHRNAINYCQWFAKECHCKPRQKVDFSSNHTFDMAITITIVPLMLGLTIVICNDETKKDLRQYLKYLKKMRIHLIKLTPSFLKALLQEVAHHYVALPFLKTIILGGEHLSTIDCRMWLSNYPHQVLYNEYGPTEATVGITLYPIDKKNVVYLGANAPIGVPGNNMKCVIINAENKPAATDEAGELYIGGACLARGYLNKPELTAKQFVIDPFSKYKQARLYKTGDLCRQRADGIIEYLGRIDAQIKIRGFRIEPGEIEQHLTAHPAIDSAAVLAQKDASDEKRLVAYCLLRDQNHSAAPNELREYLKQHVPDYMIPSAFVMIDSFPLTANGKLDIAKLPIPQFNSSHNYKEPTTDIERKLAEIWSAELGVAIIGVEDDFFELGGHSLSAARIVSKINHILKKNISLHDFYQKPNIASLSLLINKSKKSRKRQLTINKKLYQNLSNIPLSDFQFMLWMSHTFEAKAKKFNITVRKQITGRLNKAALEFAFKAVLKKQEVLLYRILKFRPAQFVQDNLNFKVAEHDLDGLSCEHQSRVLEGSFIELNAIYPWPKDSPLLMARLFHINEHLDELQISIAHMVSDDVSPNILLADLSKFYLLYDKQPNIEKLKTDKAHIDYVLNEQHYLQTYFERDAAFWDNYLQDASLFAFPKTTIIKNMQAQNLAYSSYLALPEQSLEHLKQFCAKNHISANDGLSAALTLAIFRCSKQHPIDTPYVYLNLVKSTRDNAQYDDTIGCFLRLEPVKVAYSEQQTLSSLSQQIHQSKIETSDYQKCSSLVKLSSINSLQQTKNRLSHFLINCATSIYASLFNLAPTYRNILKKCSGRLISFQRCNKFVININVRNNFFESIKKNHDLFGLNALDIKNNQEDLVSIDYFFDACFLRDQSENTPYLVISANLHPIFREAIAKKVIEIMDTA